MKTNCRLYQYCVVRNQPLGWLLEARNGAWRKWVNWDLNLIHGNKQKRQHISQRNRIRIWQL